MKRMKEVLYNKLSLGFLTEKALLIGLTVITVTLSFTTGYIVGKSQGRKEAIKRVEAFEDQKQEASVAETASLIAPDLPVPSIAENIEDSQEVKDTQTIKQTIETQQTEVIYYTVQVGAFRVRSEAERLLQKLQMKGYPARIESSRKGKGLYRVRVGMYTDKATAQEVAIKITRNEGLKTLVLKEDKRQ